MIEAAELRADDLQRENEELRDQLRAAMSQQGYWYRRCEFAETALEAAYMAMGEAADTFRQYAEHHAAKPDAVKAKRNMDMADALALAIGHAYTVLAERRKTENEGLVNYEDFIRNSRQTKVLRWSIRAFGGPEGEAVEEVISPEERALRFLEEAIELYQAVVMRGVCTATEHERLQAKAVHLVNTMFKREPGEIGNEIGGVMVTLNCLAEVMGHSISAEERREFERVLSFPAEFWRERWLQKRKIGL